MKKVLAFDIDKTLNEPKLPIKPEMAELLMRLLEHYQICIISGQKFEQFLVQIINPMENVSPELLKNMHLMVAQGTQYYTHVGDDWHQEYNYSLNEQQVKEISDALETAARDLGYWVELSGDDEIIENRLSMIAYSALGQKAGLDAKLAWDPDMVKRTAIVARARELAPDYDYEIGGTTTINAFPPGMNKVFGMTKLLENLHVTMDEVLYFGDMTQPGGNDFPVVEMGFDTITVRDWQESANVLRGILAVG
ncbi:MAG: HAD-IIB family hydrolase [Candidatus Nomurabacteria bacterium]|jgi:HAD superfamily hydrolase (TIGR01484 family)|nr:HAD-IIB family hydrolase [Candidatus Nomurabacteria bacterium]